MSKDIDIDQSLVGGVGNEKLGQKATKVCPNRKCSGCLHYESNRLLCLKAKQPTTCGSGSNPDEGYAPIISDSVNHQELRKKKGLKNQAPTASVGKVNQPKGPAFKVKVLNEAKKSFDFSSMSDLMKSEYAAMIIETAVEAAELLKSFGAEAGEPSAHDEHAPYSVKPTSHGSYHMTPHIKGGMSVHYVPHGADGKPDYTAAEPVHGSDQVGLPHEAVGAAVAAHHATTKMNNWIGNRNNMASQLASMSGSQGKGGMKAPSPIKPVSAASKNTVSPAPKKKGILPDVPYPAIPKPAVVKKSIAFLQTLFKSVK